MKKEVRVEDAIGLVLAHDVTKIVPGEFKGRLFGKGHIIGKEDIPELLAIGKERIFILELDEGQLHEDDATEAMAGFLMHQSLVKSAAHEGKVQLKAAFDGLLQINVKALETINTLDQLAVATKRTGSPVHEGDLLASLKAIPLVVSADQLAFMKDVLAKSAQPLLQVVPYQPMSVGIVTTGSEVFKGRITDRFGPVLQERLSHFPVTLREQVIVDDHLDDIVQAILRFLEQGVQLVLVTGGMSVDPDDRSPAAIREVATEVVTYGMPILPGAMTMLAYHKDAIIMGLPGGVIYDAYTAFDVLLPRIVAGIRPTSKDIAQLAHGGLL